MDDKYQNESPLQGLPTTNRGFNSRTRTLSQEKIQNKFTDDEDSVDPNDLTDESEEDLSKSNSNISQNESKYSQHNGSSTNERSKIVPNEEVQSNKPLLYIGILSVFFITFSIYTQQSNMHLYEEITLQTIKRDFPSQPTEMLENIEAVIDDVLKIEPIHPAVFLFLYDETTENNNFISAIARFASFKHGVNYDPIVLDEREYTKPEVKKDYGHLIHKYKPLLESRKVMVIKNLHKMPGKTAQALHSFCDEITPLVDRAVYILTLKVDSFDGNEVHTAEKQLYNNWNDLDTDILAPLVTRVSSTVIKIR